VRDGLPSRRGGGVRTRPRDLPRGRIDGTNGSWPTHGAGGEVDPKPPAICALYEDEAMGDLFADQGRARRDQAPPPGVFGQYPRALIPKILPWLRCQRSEVLHVCSGSLPPGEGIRVDIRREQRPDVVADGRALPFRDGSMSAVMVDPPYTEQYARLCPLPRTDAAARRILDAVQFERDQPELPL